MGTYLLFHFLLNKRENETQEERNRSAMANGIERSCGVDEGVMI